MKAFAYRSGLIEFGSRVIAGTLFIAQHRSGKKLKAAVGGLARNGKGAGKGQLIVPGIPEAVNDAAAGDVLERFIKHVEEHLGQRPSGAGAQKIAIDMRMTWAVTVPIIAAALQDGTAEGKAMAKEQLRGMARAADLAADFLRALRSILPHAEHEAKAGACKGCDPGNEGAEIWREIADQIQAEIAKVKS